MLRILHFLTHRTSIPWIWYRYGPSSHPTLVKVVLLGSEVIQPDFNIVFLGKEERVFVVASAFKSFILKVDMVTSIFLNIFVHDYKRIKVDCFLLSGIFVVGKIKGQRNS